jgi:hypothetical protein
MPDPRDFFEHETPKRKPASAAPFAALLGVALLVGGAALVYAWTHRPVEKKSAAAFTDEDAQKRELTAFCERFLMDYYNYSAGLFDRAVLRAEAVMTPSFLAAYNERSQDLAFKRKLAEWKVITGGIRILPGSFAFSSDGSRVYVRLAGTITFTTGCNGATGDFPVNLLLELVRSDSGYLVDNVERLR